MAEKAEKKGADEGAATLTHRVAEKADKLKWIILALVVLVIAAGAIFSYQRRERVNSEKRAENALYQATVDLTANAEEGAGLAIFGKVAKDFEGLPSGARALIFQFSYAFNTREYAAAEQLARDFLRLYPQNPMAAKMRLSLGQCLMQQGKASQAAGEFRGVIANGGGELLPESKLALAQVLEREAEEAKDNPEEYRRRLEAAEAEYNDIVVRSQISIPAQRGYWPPEVVLPADFALTAIKDKLAGYRHQSPRPVGDAAVTQSDLEGAQVTAPPSDGAPSSEE